MELLLWRCYLHAQVSQIGSVMLSSTDIDIDFADKYAAQAGLPRISASQFGPDGRRQQHASGIYFQNIPIDPLTDLAAFDYETAKKFGYFKVDFLNLTLYNDIEDEDHLVRLVTKDPDWSLFDYPEIVGKLTQIGNHFNVVKAIRPKSIDDLAVVCALMRPGKLHLLGKTRAEIDAEIWKPIPDGYAYKRAHAIAYATSIVVQLNRMCEIMEQELDDAKGAD